MSITCLLSDVPPIEGQIPGWKKRAEEASDDELFSAPAFWVMTDPYSRLTYFRVYRARLVPGPTPTTLPRASERIQRLLIMHANHREDVEAVSTETL